MSLEAFCAPDVLNAGGADEKLVRLKAVFRTIMITICLIGVLGNILNLTTLRSPSLRTVPFLYIRALGIFDLIGLSAILLHFLIQMTTLDHLEIVVYYSIWVEDVLINSFLVAGLYSAVLLTVERYLLIRKPHKKRLFSIQSSVSLKIFGVLMLSIFLHLPMALQNVAKRDANGRIVKGNNQQLLCNDPVWFEVFNWYKLFRELLRFFCVILLVVLNAIIAKSLQVAKKNRRLLIKRSSAGAAECGDVVVAAGKQRKDNLFVSMKSFTEKKLTALMIAICTIYLFGNLPQMAVMVFQNESTDSVWGFQVFRNIANTLEILNHCSNFFVFCLASSEYSRAFLTNCRCLTRLLLKIPYCAALLHARRLNSNLSGFDQRDLPHGFENSNCRRKSSLFYDFHPERKNTVCIQVTSSTSDTISIAGASQRTPSLTPFDNDCVVLRNQAATAYPALEPGDEYL